ncbi:cupin domain-containing protein [Kitasatospora sp. NBC_01560]|uniref:cupin domain-containing protein n=1 Tax=Kitasatospora sp. NBC_01560 TaxID=2975965 RepID=UPI0038632907
MIELGLPLSDELLALLSSRLLTLEPAAAAAAVEEFLVLLERRSKGRFTQPQAHTGLGHQDPAVVLRDWASDRGRTGTTQHLDVDLRPGDTAIAKTVAATGRPLLSNGFLGADVIQVPGGEGFAPHTHPGDHLLFVIGGHGTITAAGEIRETRPGQVYMVNGLVPHAVGAITDHVLLSVGTSHRALDSAERQLLMPFTALLGPDRLLRCEICQVVGERPEELEALGCTHAPVAFRGATAAEQAGER